MKLIPEPIEKMQIVGGYTVFDYLEKLVIDADHKVMYVLSLICVAMILDFITGTLAAKINPDIEFKSKVGINGILRKVASIALLMFFLPLAPLIPGGVGVGLLYVLYLGYLMMEIKSIMENHKKMGNEVTLFEDFLDYFRKNNDKEDDQ